MPIFANHLEINQNQMLNMVLHKGTADPVSPSPVAGQLFYRTDSSVIRVRDGTAWRSVVQSNKVSIGAAGIYSIIDTDLGSISFSLKYDDSTIGVDVGDNLIVKALGITNAHIATTAAIAFSKLQNGLAQSVLGVSGGVAAAPDSIQASVNDRLLARTSNVLSWVQLNNNMIAVNTLGHDKLLNGTACSVLGRSANSAGAMASISTATNDRLLARVSNALAFIQLTDGMVAVNTIGHTKLANTAANQVLGKMGIAGSVGEVQVWISTDTITRSDTTLISSKAVLDYADALIAGGGGTLIGAYDAAAQTNLPGSAATVKGDYWYVSVAGTSQGIIFNVGDVIIANQNNPTTTNPAHYIFLESNRDEATTTIFGWVKLATAQNIANGTIGAYAIIPTALEEFFENQYVGIIASKEVIIGNGTLTQFDVTHGFLTGDVIAQVFEASGSFRQVYPDVTRLSATQVRVIFSTAPSTSQYKVLIHGKYKTGMGS